MKTTLRRLFIYMLTGGASLYLGLLSLGGMYALVPLVPLAVLSFVLSIAYEGEIYLQNLTQAIKKLMKSDSLERSTTRYYLRHLFDAHFNIKQLSDTHPSFKALSEAHPDLTLSQLLQRDPGALASMRASSSHPGFFYDYLELVQGAQHSRRLKKRLKDLEKMFAELVFDEDDASSAYQQELMAWLNKQEEDLQPPALRAFKDKQALLQTTIALPLSLLAGIFSALGTTFLLFETISIVPALAAISLNVWCIALVPLTLSAGVAYGLLTYNSVTDFLMNNPFSHWFGHIKQMWNDGRIAEAIVTSGAFFSLCGLAGALTICTAGTWLTIVDENSSIYGFVTALPKWVMGVMNPMVTTISSLAFNLQNTSASLSMMLPYLMAPLNILQQGYHGMAASIGLAFASESWLQFVNPFRLLYQCLYEPLRRILFLGHLVSIGVTSDRVPGFSKFGSALLGFVAEFGEDSHYFFGHESEEDAHSAEGALASHLEEEDHHHDMDLPTRFLRWCLTPLELLGRVWHEGANFLVTPPEGVAPDHQDASAGHHDHHEHHHHAAPSAVMTTCANLDATWEKHHPMWFMEHYRKKHPTSALDVAALSRDVSERVNTQVLTPASWQATLRETIAQPEHDRVLPEDFKQRFAARFG